MLLRPAPKAQLFFLVHRGVPLLEAEKIIPEVESSRGQIREQGRKAWISSLKKQNQVGKKSPFIFESSINYKISKFRPITFLYRIFQQ